MMPSIHIPETFRPDILFQLQPRRFPDHILNTSFMIYAYPAMLVDLHFPDPHQACVHRSRTESPAWSVSHVQSGLALVVGTISITLAVDLARHAILRHPRSCELSALDKLAEDWQQRKAKMWRIVEELCYAAG